MRARSYKVSFQPEQAPVRANRVTLGDRVDAFGIPVPRLAWRWSEEDVASIRRTRQLLSDELRDCGLGPLLPDQGGVPSGEVGGSPVTAHHHLGTTRMSDDPRRGVVDRNGRVHGTGEVYVAGGSVFPTGGNANPTLTVVALAIRLADELRRVLAT
jgi:choline dehydrogenase-like flavoprotein